MNKIVFFLILLVTQSSVKVSADSENQDYPGYSEETIHMGKGIYNNTCLFCHGAKGKGARAPSLVTGPFAPGGGNDTDYMFDVIKNGRSGTIMGGFDDSLTDEEIKAVISYLRHRAKIVAEESKSKK